METVRSQQRSKDLRSRRPIQWKYCLTGENQSYIGSRGGNADNLGDLWSK